MRAWSRICLLMLGLLLLPSILLADRNISVDFGYVHTRSDNYGQGFVYGADIIEGSGMIGFGINLRRFSNSIFYERAGRAFEEKISVMYLTILGTFNIRDSRNMRQIVAGMGPQVHLITARKYFIDDRYSLTARDSRLGFGVFLRYQRHILAFGRSAFVLNAAYSWTESGLDFDPLYEYRPPPESIAARTVTAGLALPF